MTSLQVDGADVAPPTPATDALEQSSEHAGTPVLNKKLRVIHTKRLKRSLNYDPSSFDSFDMALFSAAHKDIEASIAFPTIEFPTLDGCEDEEETDTMVLVAPPSPKRHCSGIFRSHASFDLPSLPVRCGSAGSMC